MNHGLKPAHWDAILEVLRKHPLVQKAILFGSRAMGTFTEESDIDLCLVGDELTLDDQADLLASFEKLPMAQTVDLVLEKKIEEPAFLTHIRKEGKTAFERPRGRSDVRSGSTPSLPNSWRIRRLDEVAEIIDSLHKTPRYSGVGFSMVRVTDVQGGFLDLTNTLRVSDEVFNEFTRRHRPKRGDLVFSRVGSYGNVSYAQTDTPFCLGQNTALISPRINGRFLHLFLQSVEARRQIEQVAVGSTQKTVSLKSIGALQVPLPPPQEVDAIARILGALDDKIELNRKMNATLEAMARALFKSWFVAFDPVRAKAEGRAPSGMDAETAKLFPSEFVESELGMIPKGWSPRAVGDMAVLSGGKQLERQLIFNDGSIPVFGGAGIMGFTANHNADGFVISVGRVGAYCGQFFSHRGKAWINNKASLIRPNDERLAEWMFVALKHADIDVIKKGAAQPFVSNGDIANLKLLWPGERTVAAFSSLLVPLINANTRNDAESTALARIRDELLPRLLSGELPVDAAEREGEEVA